jgi:hypothetical protein
MFKQLITITCILFLSIYAGAQTDLTKSRWFYNIGVEYGKTKVNNDNISDDYFYTTRGLGRIRFENIFGRRISSYYAFIFGLNYNSFASLSTSKGWHQGVLSLDRDNYYYYPVHITDCTMKRSVSYLSIPVGLSAQTSDEARARLIIELGLQLSFRISDKIVKEGWYSSEGLYPTVEDSNVYFLVKNYSDYGYREHVSIDNSESINAKGMILMPFISAGCAAMLSKTVSLEFKATWTASMGDITKESTLAKDYQRIDGTTAEYKKTSLSYLGAGTGLRIHFK